MARPATPPSGGPAFLACLANEFQQGLVNAGLFQEFMGRWNSPAHGGPSAALPDARAERILADMRAMADEQRRRALLQYQATRRIAAAMRDYTNRKGEPDAGEFALELLYSVRSGDSSLETRSEAIFADFQTDLAEFFNRFRRRDISGTLRDRAGLENVVRELDGQATNDPVARAMAMAWRQTSERARRLFNAAGGNIPRLDRWLMPQVHNPARVERAGYDAWSAYVRQRLDISRMIDGRTGQPIDPGDVDDALRHVYVTITTSGMGETEAQLRGGGSGTLALQRQDHRFLVFDSADSWLQYQREFGSGTLIDVMFNHLRGMAKDIAAMHELGPDPDSTIRWLQQTIEREARLSAEGDPDAVFPTRNGRGARFDDFENPNQARAQYAKAKADALRNLWDVYTGRAFLEGSMDLSNAIGTAKNVFLANALGSTTLLAQTDHVVAAVARSYAGLPAWRTLTDYWRAATPGGRQEALELGILSESALNTFMTEMRYIGPVFGKEWSRWLVERSMSVSLLKPHTAAMKNAVGLTFLRHLADQSGRTWGDLDAPFREYFERYGLQEADWDAIRFTPPRTTQRGLTVIHHRDVANAGANGPVPAVRARAGLTARQELALRLLEMMRGETEAAVPSGNLRTQRLTTAAPGTVKGALWASISSLKTYALSVHTLHMYRMFEMLHQRRVAPAAAYMTMLITGGTALGFLIQQANEVAAGREPRDPADPNTWKEAAIKGAALGILAEPLVYGENAEGRDTMYELMGPLVDQLSEILTTGASWSEEAGTWISGEEAQTNAGRNTVRLLKKIAPFSTLWYTRLATDRLIYDNLQRMADGEADEAFERRRAFYEEEKKQSFWWGPGDREPNPEAILD